MSHVKAVRCNSCGNIRDIKEIVGILATEDLYNKLKSFPTLFDERLIQRTNVHYCITCYNNKVINLVKADKGSDPEAYDNEVAERAYMLRRQCVLNPVQKPVEV